MIHSAPPPIPEEMVDGSAIINIRWAALGGQTAALFIVFSIVGPSLGLMLSLAVVAVAALRNLQLHRRQKRSGQRWTNDRQARQHLIYDTLQLSLVLALTGGLVNPFAAFLLVPVTVSASVLSRRSTVGIAIIVVICVTLLTTIRLELPWGTPAVSLPLFYIGALWASLILATIFIAIYVSSTSEARRAMESALAQTQLSLEREQAMSALGELAAAAAHELGTPLSTITVIAKELANEVSPIDPLFEDSQLLLSESQRCRDILRKLSQRSSSLIETIDEDSPLYRLPVQSLLELAAEPHNSATVIIRIDAHPKDSTGPLDQPLVPRLPGLTQSLGNLIQNAVQFAKTSVAIAATWDQEQLTIRIDDDGPGFPPELLQRLGDVFVSTGPQTPTEQQRHSMGMGLFISKSLLTRSGANLRFENRHTEGQAEINGARVEITWLRSSLSQ